MSGATAGKAASAITMADSGMPSRGGRWGWSSTTGMSGGAGGTIPHIGWAATPTSPHTDGVASASVRSAETLEGALSIPPCRKNAPMAC